MIKRILVGLSGTPFTPVAVQHGIDLALAHGATLTGVTIVDAARLEQVGPVPIGGGAAAHTLAEHRLTVTRERVDEEVERFESACRDSGVIGCLHRERGETLQTLTDLWRYHDLTVLGLRSLFEYGVVENPDDQIIRLIAKGVRPLVAVSQEHRAIGRALVAYNGSMESAKALKQFCQMNPWPGVRIKITCFCLEAEESTSLLADAAGYCESHGFETETERRSDELPVGLLAHAAEWNADVIVMGATARHKIFRFILGDTAMHAMKHADVPLFLSQ